MATKVPIRQKTLNTDQNPQLRSSEQSTGLGSHFAGPTEDISKRHLIPSKIEEGKRVELEGGR